MKLNDSLDIRIGDLPARAVYSGSDLVWGIPKGYRRKNFVQFMDRNKGSANTSYFEIKDAILNDDNGQSHFGIVAKVRPNSNDYSYNSLWCSSYDANSFESWIYADGIWANRVNSSAANGATKEKYLADEDLLYKVFVEPIPKLHMSVDIGDNFHTERDLSNFVAYNHYLGIGGAFGNTGSAFTIYYWIIYLQGKLTHVLIPCERIADNEPCLCNVLTGKIYTKTTNGTGTVITG